MSCKVSLGDTEYNLGGLDHTWSYSILTSTPPSTTNITWYVNPCGSVAGDKCPEGTLICGIEEIQLDKNSITAEIIPVARIGTQRDVAAVPGGSEGVRFDYTGEKWGDVPVSAELTYVCRGEERTVFAEWTGSVFKAEIETPSACVGAKNTDPENPSSGGWGFFSFLFFLILVAFVAFVGVAVAQNRRISDVGPLSDILKELPYLLKELWGKIVGTFTSERGGYSAV